MWRLGGRLDPRSLLSGGARDRYWALPRRRASSLTPTHPSRGFGVHPRHASVGFDALCLRYLCRVPRFSTSAAQSSKPLYHGGMTSTALPDTPGTNSDCGVLIRASCGLCLYWRCHQKIVLGAWRNLSPHRTEQVLRSDRWNTSGNLAGLASLATEGSYRNAGGACSAPLSGSLSPAACGIVQGGCISAR